MTIDCPTCGGEPEVCAAVGHAWMPCPERGADMRLLWGTCHDCGSPLARDRVACCRHCIHGPGYTHTAPCQICAPPGDGSKRE